jgi:formylglycine-generating enzyme required for sulfatase activity
VRITKRPIPLVGVSLLLLVLVGGGLVYREAQRLGLYFHAGQAARSGQWPQAFRDLLRLQALDPDYLDSEDHFREAMENVVHSLPLGREDLDVEVSVIRLLAAHGDLEALADALDHAVIAIPAGWFTMGSESGRSDERPEHLVFLDAYEIDRYEVTDSQYRRYVLATGRRPPFYWSGQDFPPGQADYPVVGVDWSGACSYCTWVGKRLPSEAEWEMACRGTGGQTYPWGDAWELGRANVDLGQHTLDASGGEFILSYGRTLLSDGRALSPVGSYLNGASPWGVLDLVGNVSEWSLDWYNWSDYTGLPDHNPLGTGPPWNHSLRGSAWFDPFSSGTQVQQDSRCSARASSHAGLGDPRMGFRCARTID